MSIRKFNNLKNKLIKLLIYFFTIEFYRIIIRKFVGDKKTYPLNYPRFIYQFYNNNNNSKNKQKLLLPYMDMNIFDRQKLNFPFEVIEVEKLNTRNNLTIKFLPTKSLVLPIALIDKGFTPNIRTESIKVNYAGISKDVILKYHNRYHYIPLKSEFAFDKINIKSSDPYLIIGKPIINDNVLSLKDKKLIIHILLDALPQALIDECGYEIMPYTLEFLNDKGILFNNTYAQSEWTLSSMSGVFTGKYTNEHFIYKPRGDDKIKDPTIASVLSDAGYKTFCCSNIPKLNPISGFDKGFDRFIQAVDKDDTYIINEAIEQLNAFNGNQYIFIGLFETHESHKLQPISVQTNLDINDFKFRTIRGNSKDTKKLYDQERINVLKQRIVNIDLKLQNLYKAINNYDPNAIFVLHSDHGINFMTKTEELLGKEREKVIFIYKNKESQFINKNINEIRKLPSMICNDIGIEHPFEEEDVNYAITESLYPGKDYEIAIRSDHNVLFFSISWQQVLNQQSYPFSSSFHPLNEEETVLRKEGDIYRNLLSIAKTHCEKTILQMPKNL